MSNQSTALAPDSPFAPTGRIAKLPKQKAKRSSSTVPTGFYRRNGKPTWHFRKVVDGTLINQSTGFADLKSAIRWAEDRVKAHRDKNLGWDSRSIPTTQEYYDSLPRTKYDKWITPFVAAHATVKINHITYKTCRAWVALRLTTETRFGRPFSSGTIRTECAWLRAFFNHAVGEKDYLRENPWSSVNPHYKVELPGKSIRKRKLRLEEQPAFLSALGALNPMVERMATILIGSGLRRGEICYLQPAMVHHGALHLPEWLTKGKKARTVPVGADVLALLEAQRTDRGLGTQSEERLFPIDMEYFGEVFQKACAAAQIKPTVTPHDLRRTYASRMAFHVKPKMLAELLGHSDLKVTMAHYDDVEQTETAAVVAALPSVITG